MSPMQIKLIAGAIAIAGAFGAGMYTMNQFAKADRLELVEAQKEAQKEALKRADEHFKQQRELDRQSYAELQKVVHKANADLKNAKLELDDYVEAARAAAMDYSDGELGETQEVAQCPDPLIRDVPVGVVGLLNDARNGRPGAGVSDSPSAPDGTFREPSVVTYGDEVEHHIECGNAYRRLKAKHDGLVDWLEQQQAYSEEVQ